MSYNTNFHELQYKLSWVVLPVYMSANIRQWFYMLKC